MNNWPLIEIRKKIAELVQNGSGGVKLLEMLANGSSCAPAECDQLDFKRQVNEDDIAQAETCRDVAAFYNMYGGFIIVGIKENENEIFEVVGTTTGFDVDCIKNKLKDFTGERILISQQECQWELSPNNFVKIFILNIPPRVHSTTPISFSKDGPGKGAKGVNKRIFEKGDIPIRVGDETTTARGAKVMEIWESKPHPLLAVSPGKSAVPLNRISHNLPDRNIICPQVMGRKEALEHLWRWLPDDLSQVKVLAGEGGIGKSSVAYEFADQVSLLKHQVFEQIVWLSAKKRQFRPLTNSYNDMVETHFETYDELLGRLCDFMAITSSEHIELDNKSKLRLIKSGFKILPSLIIIDDIDSLEDSEQRLALEIGFVLSGTKTKLLLTTRNNIMYSGDVCFTVRGIEEQEFPAFFNALMVRFPSPTRLDPKLNDIQKIWEASKGSPLFAESILRLLAYENVKVAISKWKGHAGDDVRKAALLREIMQISPEARRILLALSLLSEASLAELTEVTGYDNSHIAVAIQNLSSLFLVEAPQIGSEARIRVSETTGRLVLSIRHQLATDHVNFEKEIKKFRSTFSQGQRRVPNKLVGAAILQASALERQGKIKEALETLSDASRKTTKGKRGDLLAYMGYLYSKQAQPDFELARRTCRESFNEGSLKPRLFETWFNAEWELGNYPGTEEVARAAIENSIEPKYEWRIRLAAALSSKAHAQSGGRISVSVLSAYFAASSELSEAIRLAPTDEGHKWRSNLEDTNESIYRVLIETMESPSDRLQVVRHLGTFIHQGDWRICNYSRILDNLEEIMSIEGRRLSSHSGNFDLTHSSLLNLQKLLNQRISRFPNDERHNSILKRSNQLKDQLVGSNISRLGERADSSELLNKQPSMEISLPSRHKQLLDGVLVASTTIETQRPMLPDHLSIDKNSRYYVKECFKFKIGIRLNGKERTDVNEYCISEGWVKIASTKTFDRKGNRLLIKIKGTVESYYKE